MSKKIWLIVVLALAAALFALAGCGGDDEGAATTPAAATDTGGGEAVEIALDEQNASGQSGTATLEAAGDGMTKVTIELSNPPADPQPAHIHIGACPDVGDVAHALNNVEGGASETEVPVSIEDLQAGDFAVNVHKSEAEADVYVACGDIA
jgi:Cu/Zn superoxide dismutase